MTTTISQKPRIDNLLTAASSRGHDRQQVEQCLNDGVVFGPGRADARSNIWYTVTVLRSDLARSCKVSLKTGPDGNSAGCVTCHSEQTNGNYKPYLVECVATAAVMIEWVLQQPEVEVTNQQPDNNGAAKEQQQETLLDLALGEFQARTQWSGSDTITIWQSGLQRAWLSRNSRGYVTLTIFQDAARIADRKYSKPLPIGFYSPADKTWLESHELRENYPAWIEATKKALRVYS